MSNSDDKLDQLYERMDDNAGSPPDLDAQLRAAARDSIEKSAAASATVVSINGTRWRWATAATVLLTSGLFLSLPDSQLDIPAAQSQYPTPTAVAETTDVERATTTQQSRTDQQPAEAATQAVAEPEMGALAEISVAREPATTPVITPTVENDLAADDAAQANAYSRRQSAKSSKIRSASWFKDGFSELGQSASTAANCVSYQHGPVARACLDANAYSGEQEGRRYLLHPVTGSDNRHNNCKVYPTTLDAAPTPQQQTSSNSFQFTNNGSNWSLSCTKGEWQLSRLPAASATAQDPH